MTTVDQFLTETRRDRWGRYLVVPPEGGKPVGYTRATTIAKALDDTSSLMSWGERMTAIGLAQRPDLLALVATTEPDNRKVLNDLCKRAKEHGGATARRDLGTALHAMLDKHWTDPDFRVPATYTADVAAVDEAMRTAGLELVADMHERIVVWDDEQIAGTFDLLVRDGNTGEVLVADIKTGSSVQYGALAFAIQLGIYTRADALYGQGTDPEGSFDVREPMPEVARDRAVIIHVEPGSGVCTLHTLDLSDVDRYIRLTLDVRAARAAGRTLLGVWTIADDDPFAGLPDEQGKPQPAMASTGKVDWLLGRVEAVKAAGHVRDLVCRWPEETPTPKELRDRAGLTVDQADRIAAVVAEVEKEHGIVFPPDNPDDAFVAHDLVERIAALPTDLAGDVNAELDKAGLHLSRLTTTDLVAAERIVAVAEDEFGARLADYYAVVTALLEHDFTVTTVDRPTAATVSDLQKVAGAFEVDVVAAGDPNAVVTDQGLATLIALYGNKRSARAAAATIAAERYLAVPSRFDDLRDHPLLVALTWAAGQQPNESEQTT